MKIQNLTPHPENPRKISDEQKKMLSKSLTKFGDLGCVIYNIKLKRMVGGHMRLEDFKAAGAELEIEHKYKKATKTGTVAEGCIIMGGEKFKYREVSWDETTERAAMLAANKHGGDWDNGKLIEVINKLKGEIDMDLVGFTQLELDRLLPKIEPDEDKDDSLTLPIRKTKTKPGDVYELGGHRLVCGDSTNAQHVDTLFGKEKPTLMVTDPPYGVEYEAGWRAEAKGTKKTAREEVSSLKNDDRADWYDAWVLFPGSTAYVWHASSFTDVVMDSLRRAGYEIKQMIIWNKNVHALSRSHYHYKHEPCWYAHKKGAETKWIGGRDKMTVWDVKNVAYEKDKTSHPTQKPVEIYTRAIENHLVTGESVYDPFGGSGSCLIAAAKTGRRAFIMELDPKFCDVIVSRYVKFVGNTTIKLNGKQISWEAVIKD